MKQSIFYLFSLTSILAASSLGLNAGCANEETVTTEDDLTSSLTDTFATKVLGGGCPVSIVKFDAKKGGVQNSFLQKKVKGTGGKCPKNASEVFAVLKEGAVKPNVFVVGENADLADKVTGYRFTVAGGAGENPADGTLFLSLLASTKGVSEDFVEGIGFDSKNKSYVYYHLVDGAWEIALDSANVPADAKSNVSAGECQSCHTTGQPLMKELHDSWANWHSTWFSVQSPAGSSGLLKELLDAKVRADDLEKFIITADAKAASSRVDRALAEKKLKPLMAQALCEIGEPSLIGAHSMNSNRLASDFKTFSSMNIGGLHLNPLFQPPSTGTGPEKGLEINLGFTFQKLPSIDSAAYAANIKSAKQKVGGFEGDAMFPMFGPEKSWGDISVLQDMLKKNIIDADVLADALMTDFTVATFSTARCTLASTLPDTWKDPAELKTLWGAKLNSSSLRGAKGLANRLFAKDDKLAHQNKIDAYTKACAARKSDEYTADVYKILSQKRVEFKQNYSKVVESSWLLPTDNLGSKAGALRFNATTCVLEDQSLPFAGEN